MLIQEAGDEMRSEIPHARSENVRSNREQNFLCRPKHASTSIKQGEAVSEVQQGGDCEWDHGRVCEFIRKRPGGVPDKDRV